LSFGIEDFGTRAIKFALAPNLTGPTGPDPASALSWPYPEVHSVQQSAALPAPAIHNFRYARLNPAARIAARKPPSAPTAKPREPLPIGLFFILPGSRARAVGHQLTVPRAHTGATTHNR
jgi:hypothetical protein